MDTAIKPSLLERINIRMLIFFGVLAFLIGYPVYLYVDSAVHGGIKNYGSYAEVDLKSMGNFNFDGENGTIDDVPMRWRQLDGKKILLTGEVWAPNEAGDNMHQFELVYSIAKCCFGGPPRVQERVFAIVPKDMTVPNMTNSFAKVTGILHVKVKKDGGKVTSVYVMDVDKVEPM